MSEKSRLELPFKLDTYDQNGQRRTNWYKVPLSARGTDAPVSTPRKQYKSLDKNGIPQPYDVLSKPEETVDSRVPVKKASVRKRLWKGLTLMLMGSTILTQAENAQLPTLPKFPEIEWPNLDKAGAEGENESVPEVPVVLPESPVVISEPVQCLEPEVKPTTYVVVDNDTLSDIAVKLCVSFEELARINNRFPPDYQVNEGEVLDLP